MENLSQKGNGMQQYSEWFYAAHIDNSLNANDYDMKRQKSSKYKYLWLQELCN